MILAIFEIQNMSLESFRSLMILRRTKLPRIQAADPSEIVAGMVTISASYEYEVV
jgi:hypothetical protein